MGVDQQSQPRGHIESVGRFHAEVHEGEYYIAGHRFATIASGGSTVYVLIQTGTGETMHIQDHTVAAEEGYLTVDFYENPTISATGDAPDSVTNANRAVADSPDVTVTANPTVDNTGTLLQPSLVPGGKKIGGESKLPQAEMLLADDQSYLMEITNPSTADADHATLFIGWYEHDEV